MNANGPMNADGRRGGRRVAGRWARLWRVPGRAVGRVMALAVIVPGIMALGVAGGATPAFAAAPPGFAVAAAVSGEVELHPAGGGGAFAIESGALISPGDRLVTGPESGLQVVLSDESVFTVGADSEFVLEQFDYDPETAAGKVKAGVPKGVFKLVTGRVGAANPGNVEVEMPSTTLVVRGTIAAGRAGEGADTGILLGPGARRLSADRQGAIGLVPKGAGAEVVVFRSGFFATVDANGNVIAEGEMSGEAFAALLAGLTAGGGRGAEVAQAGLERAAEATGEAAPATPADLARDEGIDDPAAIAGGTPAGNAVAQATEQAARGLGEAAGARSRSGAPIANADQDGEASEVEAIAEEALEALDADGLERLIATFEAGGSGVLAVGLGDDGGAGLGEALSELVPAGDDLGGGGDEGGVGGDDVGGGGVGDGDDGAGGDDDIGGDNDLPGDVTRIVDLGELGDLVFQQQPPIDMEEGGTFTLRFEVAAGQLEFLGFTDINTQNVVDGVISFDHRSEGDRLPNGVDTLTLSLADRTLRDRGGCFQAATCAASITVRNAGEGIVAQFFELDLDTGGGDDRFAGTIVRRPGN